MLSSLLLLSCSILGALAVPKPLDASQKLTKRCVNSATDRSCWGDYDLSTNYYEEVPDTGVTREYWFDVQNGTASLGLWSSPALSDLELTEMQTEWKELSTLSTAPFQDRPSSLTGATLSVSWPLGSVLQYT